MADGHRTSAPPAPGLGSPPLTAADRLEFTTQAEPETRYRQRRDHAGDTRDRLSARAGRISNFRLGVFGLAIAALVWAEIRPAAAGLAYALAVAAGLGFFALVVCHARLKARERRAAELAAVNEEALARLAREWSRLPSVLERGPEGHPYAHDLDIFGTGSLARLLSTAGTGVGRARLYEWLLEPTSVDEAVPRQEAVRELVPMLDFRQDIQVAGRLAGKTDRMALDEFFSWAEEGPWLLRRPLLLWAARIIPLATILLLGLWVDGILAWPWWFVPANLGLLLIALVRKPITRQLNRASLGDASLNEYADLVERIQNQTFTAAPLRRIREALTTETDASIEFERLAWLSNLAGVRRTGIFYVILHASTLWDLHVLWGFERWQRRAGLRIRAWVDHVAEIEAASALAAMPLDEPGWTFPEFVAEGDRFEAEGLAHPLLPAGHRVANDVSVGPPGTVLMVTGSNMSGKSTLIRALGLNAILALAGGPVCATRLRVPPLNIRTSMRVEDSIERGVSLFLAELHQMKRVVDAAEARGSGDGESSGRLLLYLLDEVLHGTNTAERQVAVREILAYLLNRSAIGAISTHDLELADAEALASAVRPVHFRETVHPEGTEPPMTFDYRLREGIATSTNALKLVRLVGLTAGVARADADHVHPPDPES
jgi:ABC-type multidrug transport system fused ATPase/permease subunit